MCFLRLVVLEIQLQDHCYNFTDYLQLILDQDESHEPLN